MPPAATIAASSAERERENLRDLASRVLRAQEEERTRLSRELHDEIGQTLTLILVRLRVVERMGGPERMQHELRELRQLTSRALDAIRELARDLGPSMLDDLGLPAAIESLAARVAKDTGLRVDLHLGCNCAGLRRDVGLALYRVAQEALTNVVRHAQARRAILRLEESGDEIQLTVEDDGVGFDVPSRLESRDSIGLFGMRERLSLVGGSLQILAAVGTGARVIARVPGAEASG